MLRIRSPGSGSDYGSQWLLWDDIGQCRYRDGRSRRLLRGSFGDAQHGGHCGQRMLRSYSRDGTGQRGGFDQRRLLRMNETTVVGRRTGVSTTDPVATVWHLAEEQYQGRLAGSVGGARARDVLRQTLEQLGATVTEQQFDAGTVGVATAPTRFVFEAAAGVLQPWRDYAAASWSAYAPEPLTGPGRILDQPSVDGAWVLAQPGRPWNAADLKGRGALGVLVSQQADEHGWLQKTLVGPAAGSLPVLAVRRKVHAQLSTETAAPDPPVITATAPLLRERVEGVNVLANFGGRQPRIILVAHYDGVGADPAVHFPCASDNATGVAVLLAAAHRLLERDLPFRWLWSTPRS